MIWLSQVWVVGATPLSQGLDNAWLVSYWNNTTLTGDPVLTREVSSLNYDWGQGSPHPEVQADHFSVRATRRINAEAGLYQFTVTSDDGVRLWVDNVLILDEWYDHPRTTYTADRYLDAGEHLIMVEYYERTIFATLALSWALKDPAGSWRAEYFDNTTLSGPPTLTRDEETLDFDWGNSSPEPVTIAPNRFSARWTRTVDFARGSYRFFITADDGARLWVGDRLVIDAWQTQALRTHTGDLFLPGGPRQVTVEYYENTGRAVAMLEWARLSEDIDNWRGAYFNNRELLGAPVIVREDSAIDFNWGAQSPAPNFIEPDGFSVRWTRTFNVSAGWYRFDMTVDDGGRLWINDDLLIDRWQVQGARLYTTGALYLPDGPVSVKMEYYENTGLATAQLSWTQTAPASYSQPITVTETFVNAVGSETKRWLP
jgi:hypothetical protein